MNHMHGSLIGHLIPGIYFISIALLRSFAFSSEFSTNQATLCTTTWTPSPGTRRSKLLHMEAFVKAMVLIIAISGEGNSMRRNQAKFDIQMINGTNDEAMNFAPFNAQHMSMYAGFLFAIVVELYAVSFFGFDSKLGRTISYFGYIFAFFNEAFLFACHLHGRNDVDRFVHQVVVVISVLCGCSGIYELNCPNSISPILISSTLILIQGTWFCYVGTLIDATKKYGVVPTNLMYAAIKVTCHSIIDFSIILMIFGYLYKSTAKKRARKLLANPEDETILQIQSDTFSSALS